MQIVLVVSITSECGCHPTPYTLHGGDSRLSVRLNADASLHPTLYTLHGGDSRLNHGHVLVSK